MKQLLKSMSVAACVLALHIPVLAADDRGTAAEATALVQRAAEYLKANGPAKSYAAFNDAAGQFKDRDLYVFVMDLNGKMLAHGANAKLIGKDLTNLKDSDDKLFIKTMLDVAKAKGKGWVDYKWPHPVTKAIEPKSTYVEKVDDLVIGCGIYKQ
ncbi:Single Cache domain 2-containing protein [Duganella sp. CF517]|uniref:cache domain-containing protein n=1 Tax=Duganella sp. CF517 TaxID=1881038 RepID=UPI0008BD6512|nr:cache domain-containing protein [Duganella sp. CF517]SEN88412.1 Single Cache domain 2-containing protein [Duganella sp. CF517]